MVTINKADTMPRELLLLCSCTLLYGMLLLPRPADSAAAAADVPPLAAAAAARRRCAALCFMAQAPLLPYQLKKLGSGDARTYGSLTSAFSALQLVGGLLSGAELVVQQCAGCGAATPGATADATLLPPRTPHRAPR